MLLKNVSGIVSNCFLLKLHLNVIILLGTASLFGQSSALTSFLLLVAGVSDGPLHLPVGLHGHGHPAPRRAPVDPGGRVHREVLHGVRPERRPRGLRPGQVVLRAPA